MSPMSVEHEEEATTVHVCPADEEEHHRAPLAVVAEEEEEAPGPASPRFDMLSRPAPLLRSKGTEGEQLVRDLPSEQLPASAPE